MQTRAKTFNKVYISIFICFSTKAVHLELVHDLSTSSFIAAFRRFVSRRGCPAHVYSDNATNFIGSQNELQELKRLCESETHQMEVTKFCLEQNINWHTIPPRSPHFGGLWEAAVKSAKHHFKRVVGITAYTIEEFLTLIAQIESCLNSRPLTPMSEDPSDLSVLTPGHFLIGSALTALPDPNLEHLDFNRLSRFQRMQFLLRQFWKRWSLEYLNNLQMRKKWNSTSPNVKIGSLVILKEDNIPAQHWLLARIVTLHPGVDGHVRVVTVRTQNSTFKRSITKICILPLDNLVEM